MGSQFIFSNFENNFDAEDLRVIKMSKLPNSIKSDLGAFDSKMTIYQDSFLS